MSSSEVPSAEAAAEATSDYQKMTPREQQQQQQQENTNADAHNHQEEDDHEGEEEEQPYGGARFPAVLEPTGRSALEQYGEKMREAEVFLTVMVRTWPEWRQKVSQFVRFNPWFERAIFALIVINALVIVLDSIVEGTSTPTDSLRGLSIGVDVLDNIVTWAFVIEMLLKFVGLGLWSNGSGYFGNIGNIVDCIINIFSVYATIQEMVSSVGLGNAASAVRSVRLLRTFRAVKALRHLRLLVDALFVALRRLADVGLLWVIFITFMMFIGLQLFQGRYARNCIVPVENKSSIMRDENGSVNDSSVVFISGGRDNETVYWTTTSQICDVGMPQSHAEKIARLPKNTSYVWEEPFDDVNHFFTGYICPYGQWCKEGLQTPERNLIGFENIYFALMSLTTVSVFENWDVIMYDGMYARGFAASWYFLTVAFVGSIFVLNLVLAILTDAFTQSLTILRKELDKQISISGDEDQGGLIGGGEDNDDENDDDGAPLIGGAESSAEEEEGQQKQRPRGNSASKRRVRGRSMLSQNLSITSGNRSFSHLAATSQAAARSPRHGRSAVRFSEEAGRDYDAEEADMRAQSTARRRYGAHGNDLEQSLSGYVPPGGYHPVNRRNRSYTLVNELRRKVNTNRDISLDATKVTEAELDESLDWFSNEWATVVLESRKNEDMETMAATEFNQQEFSNDGGWKDKCFGKYRRLQSWMLQNVVVTPVFNAAGFILTVINVIILSIVFPKMDPALRSTLSTLSIILSMVFVLESVVRIVGLGWRHFLRDPFNVLDGVLAITSVFEFGLVGSTAISSVRTIRLMRMLSYFPSVVTTLRTLAAAVRAAASLMVQLFIMIFVMAVLGQQLFRGELCGLNESPEFLGVTPSKLCTSTPGQLAPAFNFDSLASSVVTVFVVVAGDGWRQFWIDCSSRTTRYHSLYFIAIYVMGNYLFVNLFVAVLIDAANTSRAAGEEEQKNSTAEPGSDNSLQRVASTGKTDVAAGSGGGAGAGARGGDDNGDSLIAPLGDNDASADSSSSSSSRGTTTRRRGEGETIVLSPTTSPLDNKPPTPVVAAAPRSFMNQLCPKWAGGGDGGCCDGKKKEDADDQLVDYDKMPDDELPWPQLIHRKAVPVWLRKLCARIVLHTATKVVVAIASFLASISYLFWMNARTYPDHWSMAALDTIEVISCVVSTLDACMRWIALGRTCDKLAQAINFVSFFVIGFQYSQIPNRSTVVAVLRVFTRAIRPWTYALRFARFRLVFFSLTRAVAALRSVGIIAVLIWFTYGVLGAQLFHGKLYACTEGKLEANWGDQSYTNNRIMNESDCLAANYTWLEYKYNFDNVGRGMLALVTAATTDDWSNIMYLTTGTESDLWGVAPVPGKYLAYSIFMCSFVIMMAFFLINVVVSFLVDAYFSTKKEMEDKASQISDAKLRERKLAELATVVDETGDIPLPQLQQLQNKKGKAKKECKYEASAGELDVIDSNQQDYYDMCLHALLLVKPTMPVYFGPDSWRWKIRSFIRSRYFNYLYLFLTTVDFIFQCLQYVDQPPMSSWALLYFDMVMSIVLLSMTACRILGNSVSGFLLQSSNILEMFVNVSIFASCFLEASIFAGYNSQQNSASLEYRSKDVTVNFKHFQQFNIAGVIFGIIRNLRMFRFQRILNTFHGVRVIVFTLRTSARNFLGGLTLVFLVYYFFGALGVAMFGRVVNNGSGLTRNNNFETIPLAMQTLVRVGTLDDWEAVMRAAGLDHFPCDPHLGNCGTPWLATPFFYLFIVFGQWVAMSSFVAILLDSFSKADRRERFAVQKADVDRFRKLWKMFCDNKTQLLSVAKLPLFLQRLGPALAIEEDGYVEQQALPGSQVQVTDMIQRLNEMGLDTAGETKGSKKVRKQQQQQQRVGANEDHANVEMSDRDGDGSRINNNNNSSFVSQGSLPLGNESSGSESAKDALDLDDSNAGEEFARAVLLKKTIDRSSYSTRFCSLRTAQDYVRELRVSARESDSFSGVVTQRQVFEACVKHHYSVALPSTYEEVLVQQFDATFPLDVFRLTQALASQNSDWKPMLPDGSEMVFDVRNSEHLLQLMRLQAWWRGQRFRRVVRRAIDRAREEGVSNTSLAAETSAAIEALMEQSERRFDIATTTATTSNFTAAIHRAATGRDEGGGGGTASAAAGGDGGSNTAGSSTPNLAALSAEKNAKPKRKTPSSPPKKEEDHETSSTVKEEEAPAVPAPAEAAVSSSGGAEEGEAKDDENF